MDEIISSPGVLKKRVIASLIIFGALAAYSIYFYPLLPDPMPTHFNGRGVPDNWSSKNFGAFIGLVGQGISLIIWLLCAYMMNDMKLMTGKYSTMRNVTIEQYATIRPKLIVMMDFFIYPLLLMFALAQYATNQVALKQSVSIGNWIWIFLAYFGVWTVVVTVWSIKISAQTKQSKK